MSTLTTKYAFRLTPYLQALLQDKPADHPLCRQFLPDERELLALPSESADPIGDSVHSPVKGIVHRYPDRVLLKVHHACPVYCRFCFRREMVGPQGEALREPELRVALDYIRERREIWEVILSGGDPLALSPRRLESILESLSAMAHVGVIRIHTRVPLVAPDAIHHGLIEALLSLTSHPHAPALYIAVHVNHPEELTEAVHAGLASLQRAGAVLVSQTVLLRGVNDDARTLEALFRQLVRWRVRPYYLHHPDLAPGTSHFRVAIEAGQDIMRQLRARVSGLCQPTYVLDIPGGHGKVPIGPCYEAGMEADGTRWISDARGGRHGYVQCFDDHAARGAAAE